MTVRDVFLCHASEEKVSVLRPLVSALKAVGITFWYDEAEIRWGDSVVEKVNEGLQISRYVLVVFSQAFVEKHWPQRELNAVLNIEASTGNVRVLPLLVGSPGQQKEILAHYPILNDKAFKRWESDPLPIVEALQHRLDEPVSTQADDSRVRKVGYSSIPMPAVRRDFTQRDKDQFLRTAFEEVRAYFQVAAGEVEARYPEIAVEIEEVHRHKFTCSIYRHGEIVNRCKIWIGGPLVRDSISYAEGRHLDTGGDNSCNDWLTVEADGTELGLRTSQMGFAFGRARDFGGILDAERAAEHLWLRVTEPLNRT